MKAIYDNIKYKVIRVVEPFVILEGFGGYTFKAYMENVLIEEEPEQKLPSKRPDSKDVITKMPEQKLPTHKEDKSLIIQEMPYVGTPTGKVFDLCIEMFNKKYGNKPTPEKQESFIRFIADILSGEKIEFPEDLDPKHEKFGNNSIQLKTDDDIIKFKNELKDAKNKKQITPKLIMRDIGLDVDKIIIKAESLLQALYEDEGGSWRFWEVKKPEIINEKKQKLNLKQIATHPDLIDAIKTVYSIRGVGDRKGEYSPERTVGMLKRAAEIIQNHDKQPLTPENFLKKVISWLKLSGDRGKGRRVSGLDELEKEILSDLDQSYTKDTKMKPTIKDMANAIVDKIEGKEISKQQIITMFPTLQDNPEMLESLISNLASIGISVSENLDECGVTAVAGAGVSDATQGVAIVPSNLGLKKRLEESVDSINEVTFAPLLQGQNALNINSLGIGIDQRGKEVQNISDINKPTSSKYVDNRSSKTARLPALTSEEYNKKLNEIKQSVKTIMNSALDEDYEFCEDEEYDIDTDVNNIITEIENSL
jgi:hypothetical protein